MTNQTETDIHSIVDPTEIKLTEVYLASESITNASQDEAPEDSAGWVVVAGCFCGLFCSQGYGFTWGIYMEYYNKYVFINQMTAISWIGSLWLGTMVLLGPVYGYIVYKVGYRWILIIAMICSTLAMMLASISTEIWQLILTQGVLSGLAAGLCWFPCVSAPQQYFKKRRGMAVGIAISGSGFGGLVLSNIVGAINSTLGVGWSLRVVGFIDFALLSFAACVVRPVNPPPPCKLSQSINFKLFRNVQFCLLFAIQFLGNFAFSIPTSYLPSYAEYILHDDRIGSNLSAILCGVLIIGKIGAGSVSDYIGRANMCTICVTMTGVTCLALWLPLTNAAAIWAFAASFGLFGGGYVVMVPAVLVQCVGIEDVEASNGLLYFGWFFGGIASGPISAALINSDNGSPTYSHVIIFSGLLMVFAGSLAWAVRVLRAGWNPFIKA